jgi:small subunit ribosomal protein S7
MPPRPSILAPRRLAFRTTPIVPRKRFLQPSIRFASNGDSKDKIQPNLDPSPGDGSEKEIPHVTEEQAALDKVLGNEPPEVEERGTSVQEVDSSETARDRNGTNLDQIIERDKDAQEKAPDVIKEEINSEQSTGEQSQSVRSRQPLKATTPVEFDQTKAIGLDYPDAGLGHKFPLPDTSQWSITDHLRRRYDPVVTQLTRSLMRHGKLSVAQAVSKTIVKPSLA